jgi:hypothetical protein
MDAAADHERIERFARELSGVSDHVAPRSVDVI